MMKLYVFMFSALLSVLLSVNADETKAINYLQLSAVTTGKEILNNLPAKISVTVINNSAETISVLPFSLGSIDSSNTASALIFITSNNKEEVKLIYPVYYCGPIKEMESRPLHSIPMKSKEELSIDVYISGNWGWEEEEHTTVFSEPGLYKIKFRYYPFTMKSSNGAEVVAPDIYIESNPIELTVKSASQKDKDCWREIQKLKNLGLLYDAHGDNFSYLSKNDLKEFVKHIGEITSKHKDSVYHPYLELATLRSDYFLSDKSLNKKQLELLKTLSENKDFIFNDCVKKIVKTIDDK